MSLIFYAQHAPTIGAILDAVLLVVGITAYAVREKWRFSILTLRLAAVGVALNQLGYAVGMTVAQHGAWMGNTLTKELVAQPLVPHTADAFALSWVAHALHLRVNYFFYYVYGRFWVDILIGIGCAFLFWVGLVALKKYRSRFFDKGELEVGLVSALAVGWPMMVVFVPLLLVMVVAVSAVRAIFLKESLTTLGWPMFIAAIVSLGIAALFPSLLGHFAFLTV